MEEYPFISVLMPIRNEKHFIAQAINSVLENDYPSDRFEVLVIDGMSDDGTRDIVQKMASNDNRITLLDNPGKIVPFAMNIGLDAMKGELFTRIDGHATVARDFLKNSVDCLRQHPDAWVAGGAVKTVADGYTGNAIAAAMQSPVGVGNSRFRLGNFEGEVDTLAFGTHHKWIIDKIGNFDEQLVRNQDDEFNYRIIKGGGKIWLSQSINSEYYSRGSLKKLWRQYFQYGFWRIRTMQKHGEPATLRQMIPLIFVVSILVLAIGTLIWKPIGYLLAAEAALYCFGILAGGAHVGLKSGWSYSILAPLIFVILHIGYGLGSLWGIVRFLLLRGAGLPSPTDMKMSR